MKPKLISRLQNLGRQAEQVRQVVQAAPAQAAKLREAIVLTSGQLQQLRSEIQTGIAELRADSGDHLIRALGEIRDTTDILRQAGFELAGADFEVGLTAGQRLLLQFRRIGDVPVDMMRALASANPTRPFLRGVLAALQRATELAATVDLPGLDFTHLTVSVGPVPSLRIAWRPAAGSTAPLTDPSTQPAPAPSAPNPASGLPPVLGTAPLIPASTSVLGTPPASRATSANPLRPQPSPVPAVAPAAPAATPAPQPTPPATPVRAPLPANWRNGALDRFKKMPDLGKGR